jgi:hypothetical protein
MTAVVPPGSAGEALGMLASALRYLLFCPYGWHQVLPGFSRSQRAGSEVLVGPVM